MQNVKELERRPAPGGRPQPLTFLGRSLWVGSWDTCRVYAIDPQTWEVTAEVAAPGKPYGLAAIGDEMRVVVSIGDEDDRYLYRFVPGRGFDPDSKTPCPDLTGSHLASDGTTLYLGQMGFRRIVALDDHLSIVREIALPTRCVGMGFGPGAFYVISADEEFENLRLATLDLGVGHPDIAPRAAIPFDARSLAFSGSSWWTSHREAGEIVSFTAQ
ncbi:MAG: YncE family protein [Vulcanimicrobiaceae bacterium]